MMSLLPGVHWMLVAGFVRLPSAYFSRLNWFVFGMALVSIAGFGQQAWAYQDSGRNENVVSNDELGPTPGLDADEIRGGWISLFDGKTLFGWKATTAADWHVAEGEIRVSSGERGLLRTTSQFDDYELVLEFKAPPKTNSGVFLRTSPKPGNPAKDCYELNIVNRLDNPFPTGALVGRANTDLDFAPDQWHHFRVLADGPRIKVWVDDQNTVDYEDPNPLGRGYIGLQLNSGPCAFRKIRLKPINLEPIPLTNQLEAWNTNLKQECKLEVSENDELRISNGPGQIESKKEYGDFVFSMLCRTNAEGLNSGVFFRSIPGELMNGYESQIQNQFKNGNRTEPVDCGTGGIFRRANARRVNANDNEWFAKTIITNGPHISVWVNGFQVTDWTDQRKPDANPRKGLRLEPGTLIFQAHDPTTDISFRDIKVRELSKRGK